ncbi:CG3544 [Drosophila busckii]|uniref:CG3544 n=1 Tax=Drosophila busckii TaxID=30019 RepID=A0A0M3QT86_DROBS|nr:CG3544 [Drosophila busckii]
MEQSVGGVLEMSKLTGAKCHPRLAGPQIRKVYETQRSAYNETKRISLVSSFLASLLVGNIASIDYTEASGMNLFDLQSMQWSQQCLDACAPDLRKRLMPPIAANRLQGRIADYYVKRWNFRADCMIVAGMGAHCSAIAGVKLDDNWLVLTLGSYDAISMDFKQRPDLHEAHVLCHPTKPHEFVGMLAFRNGSKLREDMCQLLANGDWDRFAQMLRDTPMGNEGHIAAHFPERGYYPFAKGTLRWTSDINQMSQLAMEGVKSFPRPELEARALIEGQMMHYRSLQKQPQK